VVTAPARDLREFRWHTGGAVRPLGAGEPRPVVFRDLGPAATLRLLEGRLARLAGPTSPVTYLRTAAYREPFVDHGHFGRIAVLPCAGAAVWHAGIAEVFIADAEARFEPGAMALVPDDGDLDALARQAAAMRDARELREQLGGAVHDDWLAATADRLRAFGTELAEAEARLAPLRRAFQAPDSARRRRARDDLAALGLTEVDLCAAWHHIAPARRAEVIDRVRGAGPRAGRAGEDR
jgi:hypothetical protein